LQLFFSILHSKLEGSNNKKIFGKSKFLFYFSFKIKPLLLYYRLGQQIFPTTIPREGGIWVTLRKKQAKQAQALFTVCSFRVCSSKCERTINWAILLGLPRLPAIKIMIL
jgi:hypothetical protein